MQTALLTAHIIITIALIGLILIQRGKGADVGASFGGGASQTVFGSQGSASFLTRTTAVLATLFFVTSLTLAYFATQKSEQTSVVDMVAPAAVEDSAPDLSFPEVDTPTDVPMMPSQSGSETEAAAGDVPAVDLPPAPQ